MCCHPDASGAFGRTTLRHMCLDMPLNLECFLSSQPEVSVPQACQTKPWRWLRTRWQGTGTFCRLPYKRHCRYRKHHCWCVLRIGQAHPVLHIRC